MADLRREIQLPSHDLEFLERYECAWETFREASSVWLILQAYGIPAGYNQQEADAALQIPSSYPEAQIDMVYFRPHLALASGRPIGALSGHQIEGRNWQRWSRHRTSANPWRPGLDSVETHMLLVHQWLSRELEKAA